jgi:tetratricopeptide (TPR) repeat protein
MSIVGHPDYEKILNNLAVLYIKQHSYADAARVLEEVLSIRKNRLGVAHPDIAMNNLAATYRDLGDTDNAKSILLQSLTISRKTFGISHQKIAVALRNLAQTYVKKHQYNKALNCIIGSNKIDESFSLQLMVL